MLASVAGQKSRRPQFVGIAKVLRLPARQRHSHALASSVIEGSRPGRGRSSSAAIEPSTTARSTAALNGLMMQSERPTDRKKRRIFPIGQQYPRPPTRLAGSVRDCAIDLNFTVSSSPSDIQSPAATLP